MQTLDFKNEHGDLICEDSDWTDKDVELASKHCRGTDMDSEEIMKNGCSSKSTLKILGDHNTTSFF